jgi:L-alanine-DL-glutamate epimerase-like enolase superfamily enzyme
VVEIAKLSAEPLDIELSEPFGIAGGSQHTAANLLVTLELDDGTAGLGEAAPFPAVNGETQADALAALGDAASLVLGLDAARWRHVASGLRELSAPSARCAVECALFDALCRRAGISLWSWFGGAERELRTDITIPTGSTGHARRSAERATARGFSTLKIKVGGVALADDIERLRAILEAAPHSSLLLDANASLTADEALALLDALGDDQKRVVLFEQPTPAGDHAALRRVRQAAGIPVAADESARSAADVADIVRERAADVVNIKIMKCGVVEALDMIATARASGLGLMVGGMVESQLAMSVSASLAAGSGGFAFVDLDTLLFMRDAPLSGGARWRDAAVCLDPSARGHGVVRRPA